MAKRIAYIIATVLEIAALAGIAILHHFSVSRLGMMRWLNYHNKKWAEAMPLDVIIPVAAVVAVIAALALIAWAITKARSCRLGTFVWCSAALSIILAAVFLVFTLSNSTTALREFYLSCACFGLAVILQLVKTSVCIGGKVVQQ